MPTVSVIIPNYNYEKYLSQRLTSIIQQSFKDFEIIFLDDWSKDDSIRIAKEILAKTDIPYKMIINEKNSGSPFIQWNRGVKEAVGEYQIMDSRIYI